MPRLLSALALLVVMHNPVGAAINNTFPGDFTALPAGATSVTLYQFDRRLEGPYTDGIKGPLQTRVGITALRVVHYYDIGTLRANVLAAASRATIDATSGPLPPTVERERKGMSDLRLAATLYPIADLKGRHHLGLNLQVILPTGAYDSDQLLNPGENRTRYIATLGWIRSLTPQFTLDLIAEAGWYGDNTDPFGSAQKISQAPSQALTAYLRYHPSKAVQLFLGSELNRGGSRTIDGVELNDPAENRREFLGGILFLERTRLLNLRFARDASVENGMGYRQEITLRFTELFR